MKYISSKALLLLSISTLGSSVSSSSPVQTSNTVHDDDVYSSSFIGNTNLKGNEYNDVQFGENVIDEREDDDNMIAIKDDDDVNEDDMDDDDEWLLLQYEYYQAALRRLKKEDETQWGLPENYTNTLWNCLQFNNVKIRQIEYKERWKDPWSKNDDDKGYNLQDDTVDCSMDSWEWDAELFDPELMPKRCRGWNLTPKDIRDDNDDYIEPCVLWHLTYGDFLPSSQPSTTPSSTPSSTPTYDDPSTAPSNIPSTEPSTEFPSFFPSEVLSKTPSLIPSGIPSKTLSTTPTLVPTGMLSSFPSSGSPSTQPSSFSSQKPSIVPTAQVSASPSTTVPSLYPTKASSSYPSMSAPPSLREPSETPSFLPTSNPTQSVSPSATNSATPSHHPSQLPTSSPSGTPTIDWSIKPSLNLSPFVLTLTFRLRGGNTENNDQRLRHLQQEMVEEQTKDDKEIIRAELLKFTSSHLHDYLEQALGLGIGAVKSLESVASEQGNTFWMEDIEGGVVYFNGNTAAPTENQLDILVKNAFLGVALDDFIAELQEKAFSPLLQSTLYAEVNVEARNYNNLNNNQQGGNGSGNRESNQNSIWSTGSIMVVAAAGVACLSMVTLVMLLCTARGKARRNFLLATKNSALSSSFSSTSDLQDEIGSKHITVRQPTKRPTGSDYDSDNTSVYSYKQYDADDSVSLAPSFLHAINERTALGEYYNIDDSFENRFSPIKTDPSSPSHGTLSIPSNGSEMVKFKKRQKKMKMSEQNYIEEVDEESSMVLRTRSITISVHEGCQKTVEEKKYLESEEMKTPSASPIKAHKEDNQDLTYRQEFGDLWAEEDSSPQLFLHDLPGTNISFDDPIPGIDKYAIPLDSIGF